MDFHFYLFWAVVSFLLGTIVGSFVNVVIVRVPREESIVSPPSRCPDCGRQIRYYDNIPIISYILLGGRCRDCRGRISPLYPLVEFITGALFLGIYLKWGIGSTTVVYFVFTAAMIAVFWIDLEHMIIPDVISLNCIPVGIAAAVAGFIPGLDWKSSIAGSLLGVAVLYVPAYLYEKIRGAEGLGGGDVKLMAMIGAFTGPYGVMFVLLVASTVGSLVGLAGMVAKRTGATTPLPFGPFLAAAAAVYIFIGAEIIERFSGLFSSY